MATRFEFINYPGHMVRRITRPRTPSAFFGYGQAVTDKTNGEFDMISESEGPFNSESEASAWVSRRIAEADMRGQRIDNWWTEVRDDGLWDATITYAEPEVVEEPAKKKTSMLWLIVPTVVGIAAVTGVVMMAGGKKRGKK